MKRIIKLILIFFGYQVLTILPISCSVAIGTLINPEIEESLSNTSISIALLVSSALTIWHLIHFGYIKVSKETFSPISWKTILATLVLAFSAITLLAWLSEQVELPDWMGNTFADIQSSPFGIVAICLLGPIAEEFLFRAGIEGYLLNKWKNPKYAIIVSALIFGIIHINPAQTIFAFLFGLLLGWLYYRTRSLLHVIIIHVLNNSLSTIFMEKDSLSEITSQKYLYFVLFFSVVLYAAAFYYLNRTLPKATDTQLEQNNDIEP